MTALKLVQGFTVNEKKDYINRIVQSEPKTGVLFSEFIKQTVERKAKRMSISYTKNYASLIHHLDNFANIYDVNIYTNSINEVFIDDFIMYLEEHDYKHTYIKALLSLIKSMSKKAGSYGYAVDPSFDDIYFEENESFAVFLSLNEITRIYYYDNLTKAQKKIRDLFIVGCLTALRYSDYSTLTKQNFTHDFITKTTKKTNKKVIVPLHDYVREIVKKYDGSITPGLSIQHFNKYIKLICKKIGINDEITYSYKRGGKLVTETKQKWELISSHTARRSAATNMYLTGRMKTFEIMAITGHTTEKSFFKYIKVTKENIVNQIAGDSFFRK